MPVTREIDPDRARDLLVRVPRACIAFAYDQGPQAQPIAFVYQDGHHLAGVPADAAHLPGRGQEVVCLIDEGVRFFDLRAVSVRGHAEPTDAPPGAPTGHTWFEVVPSRIGGWDFGALREVKDEA
jgi:hypothetical protein